MADSIYDIMKRRIGIDLGQVFTPLHLAEFAAKILDIEDGDVVLDSSAGSGSLLLTAAAHGASKVYGIELDERVHGLLDANLAAVGVEFETLCAGSQTDEAAAWIKERDDVTKALLNPPYEKKYFTYEILMNTLDNLPKGTQVALIYPDSHLTKNGQEWQDDFMSRHTLRKVIKLPGNTFQPFASVQTALYIITAGEPQGDTQVFGCDIQQDGLTRKKNAYREDTKHQWRDKYEPYWLNVIETEDGDDSCTTIDPREHGLQYYKFVDLRPTYEDFHRVVKDYMGWKAGQLLQTIDPSLSKDDLGGAYSNIALLMTRHQRDFARLLLGSDGMDYAKELAAQSRGEVELVGVMPDGTYVDIDEVDLTCGGEIDEMAAKAKLIQMARERGGRLEVPLLVEEHPDWSYMENYIKNIEMHVLGEAIGLPPSMR